MNKAVRQWQLYFHMALFLLGSACNGYLKQETAKEKEHPRLIKNIGNPAYGNVQCSMQDKEGNLWFGTTENGLYKYNGKTFRQYLKADGLNSNDISALLQDKTGKLWIGTHEGICMYDPSTAENTTGKMFREIKNPLITENKSDNNSAHWVFHIMQSRGGSLWFATLDGVFIFDGQTFTQFNTDKMGSGLFGGRGNAERIFEDKDGNIWLGGRTSDGVFCFNGKTLQQYKLTDLYQDGPKPKPHHWAWPQWQDKNGNIWFSNWGGAYKFNGKSFTSYSKTDGLPGMVTRIAEDHAGNLWFGGAALCSFKDDIFTCHSPAEGESFPGVWCLLEDKDNKLWIGTRETSLYMYNGKEFTLYSEYHSTPEKK